MARQNQFDKAVKGKIQGLEAEPSARVWAGIREAVPAKSGPSRGLYIKLAALLILIGMSGGAWWYFSGTSTENSDKGGKQLTEQSPNSNTTQNQKSPENNMPSTSPNAEGSDQENNWNGETLADNATENNATENANVNATDNANVNRAQSDKANTDYPNANDARAEFANSPKRNSPTAKRNGLTDTKNVKTKDNNSANTVEEPLQISGLEWKGETPPTAATEKAPVQLPTPTLQEIIAREDALQKDQEAAEKVDVEAESETGRRRRLDLSNLDRDEMRAKTGNVLGNLAQGAGEAIGIRSNVTETETDTLKTKEVTVKFGPLKFKRVKNTKR